MAKRSNGEGTLRRRADGRWEYRVMDGYREDGKPRLITVYGRTQKQAREKMAAYKESKFFGVDTAGSCGFSEWANIWFSHHRSNIAPTTQENYSHTLKSLCAHFGSRKLHEIKPMDIELFLKEQRAQGRSDSHLSHCRGMLFQIFNKAEANDLVRKNPVRYADKMRSRGPEKEKDAFTADEVKLLMQTLPQDRTGISIRLMLGTGMRTQELLALEPRHIAEDGSLITIEQAINMVHGTATVGLPKSRDSYRTIPVPPSLRWCAVKLRTTEDKYIWEVGKKGVPCNPSCFRDRFKAAVAKVEGARLLTPHCCRHTYVSQMQAIGVELDTIKSIVGHADVSMTRHYLHVQESVMGKAAEKFSEVFGGGQNRVDSMD